MSSPGETHGALQRSTRLTLNFDALTRLHSAGIRSYAIQLWDTRTISTFEPNTKRPGMVADLGSGGLNFERHRLDIVI